LIATSCPSAGTRWNRAQDAGIVSGMRSAALAVAALLAGCSPAAVVEPQPAPVPEPVVTATPTAAPPTTDSSPPAAPGSAPAAQLPADPAERIAELQRRLRGVPADDPALPAGVPALLDELKRASTALVAREIDAVAAAHAGDLRAVSESALVQAVEGAAHDAGVDVLHEGDAETMGGWHVLVTRSKKDPRYLVANWELVIPCGSDGGLLVYELGAGKTRLVMTLSSPTYEAVDGAFWQLSFALPPAGKPEDFFLTAVRVTPWCTSAMRRIQILVLRPGPTADAPVKLVDEELGFHLLHPYALDVGRGDVRLSAHDGMAEQKRHWRIEPAGARLLEP
jgi:hypothetical protein